MDRTREKIELAQELELTSYLQFCETKKEINKLTQSTFKPITHEEIRKKLKCSDAQNVLANEELRFATGLVGGLSLFCIIYNFIDTTNIAPDSIIIPAFISCLAHVGWTLLPKKVVDSKKLKEWKNELPYGALLSVKEANLLGLNNFRIFYPANWGNYKRIISDPVIVGYHEDVMYEIFAWDDGKVYE